MRRAQRWETRLSEELRTSAEARHEYYLALIDEGFDWKEALKIIIEMIGVKEYSELVGDVQPSNLINQLKDDSNITIKSLKKFLSPLHVKLTAISE